MPHSSPMLRLVECASLLSPRKRCWLRHHASVAATFALTTVFLTGLGPALASTVVYSGNLANSANAALVGSGPSMSPADFTDAAAVSNNVALYTLALSTIGSVEFVSSGFAEGGVDPYFTLFSGLGAAASFVGSNYDLAFLGGGGDFDLSFTLQAGSYVLALGAFANLSFAENLGAGSLGDGFIALGQETALGNGSYALTVITPDNGGGGGSMPEPASAFLVIGALLACRLAGLRSCGRPLV